MPSFFLHDDPIRPVVPLLLLLVVIPIAHLFGILAANKRIPGDVGAQEILGRLNAHEGAMDAREDEIQNELKRLYAQLDEFSDPTPADEPSECEGEELEAFEKLKEQIGMLENEVAEIMGQQS